MTSSATNSIQLFKEEIRKSLKTMTRKIIALYVTTPIFFILLSLVLPDELQISSSILAGITVAFLLAATMIISHGFSYIDIVFIGGILFLLLALFKRSILPPTILQNFGHYALIISLALTSSYVALRILHGNRMRSHEKSVKSIGDFFSVSWTTLSSELCYCMHPIPLLEQLGILSLLPGQVKIGFAIIFTTLIHHLRLTYKSYLSRSREQQMSHKSEPQS